MLKSLVRRMAQTARQHPIACSMAALLAPVALFYLPLLAATHTFPDGDFTHHFLPFALLRADALRQWHLPLWNPHTYAGHPFLADTQAAFFYPVSALLEGLTSFARTAEGRLYWLQVEAILATALAGGFTCLLVRGLGAARWAALTAGIVFALSGYLVGYPPLQLAVLRTAIWLPLILWLLLCMAQQPQRWRYALGLVVTIACTIFAGHPQTWLHSAYAAAAWGVALTLAVVRARGWRSALQFATIALMSVSAAVALAAAQLQPSIEFTQLSVRANVDYAFVSGGFPLQDALQIVLPGVLTHYSPLFVGAPALLLALVALWRTPPTLERALLPGRAAVWFFLGLALVGLLLSFGDNAFLFPLAYKWLPGWDLFRGQERAALLVALALAVLAGLGAHALPTLAGNARRTVVAIFALLIVATVLLYALHWQLAGYSAVDAGAFVRVAVTLLAFAGVSALLVWRAGWSDARMLGMVALCAGALFAANFGINLEAVTPQARMLIAPELQALQQAMRVDATEDALPGRVYNEYRAYEDYAIRLGLEDLWGSSPLRLARYAQFNEAFPLDRWWTLTGATHALTWRRELFEPSALRGEFPQAADATYLHRMDATRPRAWFVQSAHFATDAEALTLLADHQFDLAAQVILPSAADALVTPAAPIPSEVALHRLSSEAIQVQLTAPVDGLLFVSENWMPGWRVENLATDAADPTPVFGMEAFSVQRANLAFIAIPVPAGSHAFTLRYAPDSVRLGMDITLGVLALLIVLSAGRVLAHRGWLKSSDAEKMQRITTPALSLWQVRDVGSTLLALFSTASPFSCAYSARQNNCRIRLRSRQARP